MTSTLLNILFGLLPTFVLGANLAAEADDDARRRSKMFLLVYGLWSLTLAMWNWMRSYPLPWIGLWLITGIGALVLSGMRK